MNGIFLAKALAGDRSQQGLRDLWLNEADIQKLFPGWRLPLKLKAAKFLMTQLLSRGTSKAQLDGPSVPS